MQSLTINDLILLVPMALAGALFLGAVPVASKAVLASLRVVGALLGVLVALALVEVLPVLI
jgi:hypothetical protein